MATNILIYSSLLSLWEWLFILSSWMAIIPSADEDTNTQKTIGETTCDDMPYCSHDCFAEPPYAVACYCYGQPTNVYCPSDTLVLYLNEMIEVIGYNQDNTIYDRSKQHVGTETITSIAYNTRDATVLFVSQGKIMYSWDMYENDLQILHNANSNWGVAKSAYDRDGHNWFLVSKAMYSIYAINLNTKGVALMVEGNTTHFPVDLVLFPEIGFMFILWSINGGTAVKCRPMTAELEDEKQLYIDKDVQAEEAQLVPAALNLCKKEEPVVEFWLFDKRRSEEAIEFIALRQPQEATGWNLDTKIYKFNVSTDGRRDFTPMYRNKNKMIFWTDNSNDIFYGEAAGDLITEIPDFKPIKPKFFKSGTYEIYGIREIFAHPPRSDCFYRNGWCAHLCLSTEFQNKVCKCSDADKYRYPNSSTCELNDYWTGAEKQKDCTEQKCEKKRSDNPLQLGIVILLIVIIILLTIIVIKQFV